MILKDGVSEIGLQMEMRIVKVVAGEIWKRHGQTCVMTAGTEYSAKRVDGTLHPLGYALDFRSHYFKPDEKYVVSVELQAELGKAYDVLLTDTHIHVEYDKILRDK